jgi:hypothetical protein
VIGAGSPCSMFSGTSLPPVGPSDSGTIYLPPPNEISRSGQVSIRHPWV